MPRTEQNFHQSFVEKLVDWTMQTQNACQQHLRLYLNELGEKTHNFVLVFQGPLSSLAAPAAETQGAYLAKVTTAKVITGTPNQALLGRINAAGQTT